MTIEADDILHQYTVAGIGPYAVSWPYLDGGLIISVSIDGIVTPIDAVNYAVDPIAGASGNVFLTAPAAATHAGRALFITRQTPAEQGWVGVLGEREAGLEAQLDRLVMVLQELKQLAASSLRIQGAAPQPAYITGAGVLMWDGTTLEIGPNADVIAAAQSYATTANAAMVAALNAAAAAATFNPSLYLAKADNLAGLNSALTALQTGLGFSSYMAGLRATADLAALQTALGLSSPALALKTNVGFTDVNGAAVRLLSEGFASPTDAEFATAAWAKGYAEAIALGIGQSWQSVGGSRAFNTAYQNTTSRPIVVSAWTTNSTNFTSSPDVSPDGVTWLPTSILPTATYSIGTGLARAFIVPPGHFYRITMSGTAPAFTWLELR